VHYGRRLGAAVGCTEASSLAACLTAVPVERIYEHAAMFSECSIRGDMNLEKPNPWAPTVDGFAEEAFVPASSEQLLRQGQVNTRSLKSSLLYCWNEFLSLFFFFFFFFKGLVARCHSFHLLLH
jgi:hypothetical protein